MRGALPQSGVGPFIVLVAALVAASAVVENMTPASLLPPPERPFASRGNPLVRMRHSSYPRHATGADDVQTMVGAPPHRLVSQSSSTDEFLYTVVPPERVVGVSESAYRESISNVYALARRYHPAVAVDPERVLRLEPDLVFTPTSARSDVPGLLRAAQLPVYRMDTAFETLASIEAHIRLVGYLTGEDARADSEACLFRAVIDRATHRKPAGARSPRVMGFGGIYSYGSKTLFNDILRVLGAENVAAGIDESVSVTAAGLPQVTQETSKAITVIDNEQIQARNGHALTEIVRFTPGVQIRNSGGPGQNTQMRIRGLRADAAAVLVDGLRFRDASTTQADASSFLSTLNFVGADRVEVLRGSGSSLYGTNAVGGVVNVVTRPGGGPLRGEGQVEGGSLGHIRARGSIGGGALGDRLRYSVGGLQYHLLDGLDGNDAARSTGGQGLVHYNLLSSASLMLRVFGSDDRVDINVSRPRPEFPPATSPRRSSSMRFRYPAIKSNTPIRDCRSTSAPRPTFRGATIRTV